MFAEPGGHIVSVWELENLHMSHLEELHFDTKTTGLMPSALRHALRGWVFAETPPYTPGVAGWHGGCGGEGSKKGDNISEIPSH